MSPQADTLSRDVARDITSRATPPFTLRLFAKLLNEFVLVGANFLLAFRVIPPLTLGLFAKLLNEFALGELFPISF